MNMKRTSFLPSKSHLLILNTMLGLVIGATFGHVAYKGYTEYQPTKRGIHAPKQLSPKQSASTVPKAVRALQSK